MHPNPLPPRYRAGSITQYINKVQNAPASGGGGANNMQTLIHPAGEGRNGTDPENFYECFFILLILFPSLDVDFYSWLNFYN